METPHGRLKALRKALGLTQQQVASASDKELDRVEVNKIENGRVGLGSFGTIRGFAAAFGMRVDELSAYIDGDIDLQQALRIIKEPGAAVGRRRSKRLRDRAEWDAALAGAKRLFPAVSEEHFHAIGRIVDSLTVTIDAQLLGEMARSLWEATLRHRAEVTSSVPPPTNDDESNKNRT